MSAGRAALYRADWVLPVAAPPIREGAVLVDGHGRIAAVGPRAAIARPEGVEVVELGAAALLPGLVNVHAHPELAMFRGALEALPFREWILRLVGHKRAALGDADFAAAAEWTALEAIRAGITTLGATEASSAAMRAFRAAGVRGIVYQESFGPDPAQAAGSLAELRAAVERLLPEQTERVRLGVSPHAPYTVSDALYRGVAELAIEQGLPMALHIAESEAESRLVGEGAGDFAPGLRARSIETPVRARTPIELLHRLGVLEARPLLIHCVRLDERDVERIAASGATVAHCPIANAKLGHGVAPVLRLRDAGVTVGLGTDSVGSNNRLDLLEEARFAALLQRAEHRSPTLLDAAELLRLCTLDGARALGLDHRVGTLEPGKEADLCAVSLAAPHTRPVYDPVVALFHAARASDVVLSVVQGEVLMRDGEVRTLDQEGVGRRVEEAARRLRELR